MTITGVHHAQITIPVGAEEQARHYYCHLLGLPEIEKPDSLMGRGGFWLLVGDLQVHVGVEDGFERTSTKAHLAYQVTDIALWRQRLEEHNFTILDGVPIPGYERFETRDPFGNRLEFIQACA
ncbi:glyoxalase [Dictyobacter alpinus]|uniref:Glyoxalase n=1 Tax=Dictyobacter alpinus TaxID=2014873 RepID=A0A402B1Q4_9CHLR|nr:VOC family protein [Dictyobacter alpinus]GCE25282.1 glyoxalase [Dictyobacter alpinus]